MIFPNVLKNWRVLLVAVGAVAAWGTIFLQSRTIGVLEDDLTQAKAREAVQASIAATERGNATRLAEMLAEARQTALVERRAREAAQAEKDASEAASEQRSDDLRETIIIEREADVTLDQCLDLDLPDSVVQRLPFRAP